MRIRVEQIGGQEDFNIAAGSTVNEALWALDKDPDDVVIRVGDVSVSGDHVLQEGAILSIAPNKVKGA